VKKIISFFYYFIAFYNFLKEKMIFIINCYYLYFIEKSGIIDTQDNFQLHYKRGNIFGLRTAIIPIHRIKGRIIWRSL